jgi:hypothetical protein
MPEWFYVISQKVEENIMGQNILLALENCRHTVLVPASHNLRLKSTIGIFACFPFRLLISSLTDLQRKTGHK